MPAPNGSGRRVQFNDGRRNSSHYREINENAGMSAVFHRKMNLLYTGFPKGFSKILVMFVLPTPPLPFGSLGEALMAVG